MPRAFCPHYVSEESHTQFFSVHTRDGADHYYHKGDGSPPKLRATIASAVAKNTHQTAHNSAMAAPQRPQWHSPKPHIPDGDFLASRKLS
jgi:hypothetical protein